MSVFNAFITHRPVHLHVLVLLGVTPDMSSILDQHAPQCATIAHRSVYLYDPCSALRLIRHVYDVFIRVLALALYSCTSGRANGDSVLSTWSLYL